MGINIHLIFNTKIMSSTLFILNYTPSIFYSYFVFFRKIPMPSVNKTATHKYAIVLNEKAPIGKLLSATGQLAMSLQENATAEQKKEMSFIPFLNHEAGPLITLSTCSFVILKGNGNQILTLYSLAKGQGILSALFTSSMSFNGIEEDLILKTATTPLDQVEPYGVAFFGPIDQISPLTKKFSVFK